METTKLNDYPSKPGLLYLDFQTFENFEKCTPPHRKIQLNAMTITYFKSLYELLKLIKINEYFPFSGKICISKYVLLNRIEHEYIRCDTYDINNGCF